MVLEAPIIPSQPAGHKSAAVDDLKRARAKVPRAAYKGHDFTNMSSTLNQYLLKEAPNSRDCDTFTVEELQNIQIMLFMLRDPELDNVYHNAKDARRMRHDDIKAMTAEWEELNSAAATDPDLARMHRDGHCHEAVMWYVHHLPQTVKVAIKDKAALPLLSAMRHQVTTATPHTEKLQK